MTMRLFKISLAAGLAISGVVGCAADRGEDDANASSEGALSIPAEYEKQADWSCENKAEQLKAKNGAVYGSFEACVANGARVACTKDGQVMPGTYRACNCANDIGTEDVKPAVQCNANYAATTDRCEKLSFDVEYVQQYYFAEIDPQRTTEPKTYWNLLKLKIQNDSDKALSVDRNYKHTFPCSGPLPDQRVPHTIEPGTTEMYLPVWYTEAKFGREFGRNTSTIELQCGDKIISKTISWTRTRDASDPGPTRCENF